MAIYEAKKDGETVFLTDSPYYIKRHPNGCFTPAKDQREATGISANGTVYNLLGKSLGDDLTLDTVALIKVDGGNLFGDIHEVEANIDEMIVHQEYRLTVLELGL